MNKIILIRGANDVASAVAHKLFLQNFSVVIHETPQPASTRRRMGFTDAVFDGSFVLDGVEARRVNLDSLRDSLTTRQFIPLATEDFGELLLHLPPDVLIDARMRKHSQPETQIHLAPLTIGLGPNFIAGETTHLVIETNWGTLGKIIERGASEPLQGEPREIEGHARDRYVYAPKAGTFFTSHEIGGFVKQGEEVAKIDSTPILAPISGRLRGLTRSGVPVQAKTKIVEVDPRNENAQVSGIGERPAKIAEGALRAIQNYHSK